MLDRFEKIQTLLVVALCGTLVAAGCEKPKDDGEEAEATLAADAETKEDEDAAGEAEAAEKPDVDVEGDVIVAQPPGKVVYWVLPGPRKLDTYFGTADDPKLTAELPDDAPQALKDVVKEFPFVIGVPEKLRKKTDDGMVTNVPTAFGDEGIPTKGELAIGFTDKVKEDQEGAPPKTPDTIDTKIVFEDPKGNSYEMIPRMVVQPPMPGYTTQGGVFLDGKLHGTTGTGTPLFPEVYTYAAFWAAGDVKVNGEIPEQNKHKMLHCMTTQITRDKDYNLAMEEDLPLAKENTIAGQKHHTHCIALPIKLTKEGPKFEPLETAFELPNGKKQPFIHIMYEQDEIVKGPEWGGPNF